MQRDEKIEIPQTTLRARGEYVYAPRQVQVKNSSRPSSQNNRLEPSTSAKVLTQITPAYATPSTISSKGTLTSLQSSAQKASVPRDLGFAILPTPTTSKGGTRELSQQHDRTSSNLSADDFVTPHGRYTRLGPLLTKTGHVVPGGMNQGLYLIRAHWNNQLLVEKRLAVSRQSQQRRTHAEIAALTLLLDKGPHPNINRIRENFFPGITSYICIFLDFCEEGSIAGYVDRHFEPQNFPTEKFAWHVLQSVMSALAFCHFGINVDSTTSQVPAPGWRTLCHLDVKPDNVFLTMDSRTNSFPRVVLGDFGCSVTQDDIESGYAHTIVLTHGTPNWLPPEARSSEALKHGGTYGKATDIWQAGGTIQALCRLVKVPNMEQARQRRPVGSTRYSKQLNSLVSGCLEDDARKRPTAVDAWRYAARNASSGK